MKLGLPPSPNRHSVGPSTFWLWRPLVLFWKELRPEYLPPLMVYCAAGLSGLTGIVGTFFVKDYLGLSAAFLASLGFWVGIPWALKMPIGHLVDLFWKKKAVFVYLGAGLITASLVIMIGLFLRPDAMLAWMSFESWFVVASLLSPVGYVLQDAVADAMTVEAVPTVDANGFPLEETLQKRLHTTMQVLGRLAILGGGIMVSLANVILFQGLDTENEALLKATYAQIYQYALIIPFLSVSGVWLAAFLAQRKARALAHQGLDPKTIANRLYPPVPDVHPNAWVLWGSAAFVAISITVGLSGLAYGQEIVFVCSLAVLCVLIGRLLRELSPSARQTLLGTAFVIFVFRAMPGTGAGTSWWMIDELGFDQAFLARLSLLASFMALIGLFVFRRFMAEHSITRIILVLTLASSLLSVPTLAMYHGFHEWTAQHTGGLVDARFIALIDTALESPLGQISMVPLLAWIAHSAPSHLKATFFAVMSAFANLALSASQLGTKYLNQLFVIEREVRDPMTGVILTAADYSALGALLVTVMIIGFLGPVLAIAVVRVLGFKTA
jgi:hypothetical protein